MRQVKKWFLGGVLAMTLIATASAADYQKGLDAYLAGDYTAALDELFPLAQAGNADAQAVLGSMYDEGKGVVADHVKAAQWYRLAAEAGDSFAQFNLGAMYADGEGVLQDYQIAYMWFSVATIVGFEQAEKRRNELILFMTSAQIDEAIDMSQQCFEQNYKNCEALAP